MRNYLKQVGWEAALAHYDEAGGVISESDPWVFLGKFIGGIAAKKAIFLANPSWTERQWSAIKILPNFDGFIMIPTGGSTGGVKFAMHTWETLLASVERTRLFLNVKKIDSICLLPHWHVSGLMSILRALVTGGSICFQEKQSHGYLSLVPTQLKRYLDTDVSWLQQLDGIFLGGAKIDNELLKTATDAGLKITTVYGMTETAAMVLANGKPMPNTQLRINDNGKIEVQCPSLFYGYYPNIPHQADCWETSDLGQFNKLGQLEILGRADNIIITGGEKVDPAEVESILLKSTWVSDISIKGEPDPVWGSKVVAYCVADPSIKNQLLAYAKSHLLPYQVPKEWVFLEKAINKFSIS